jgi:hypothetical protein
MHTGVNVYTDPTLNIFPSHPMHAGDPSNQVSLSLSLFVIICLFKILEGHLFFRLPIIKKNAEMPVN